MVLYLEEIPYSVIAIALTFLILIITRMYMCLPQGDHTKNAFNPPIKGKAKVLVILGSGLLFLYYT